MGRKNNRRVPLNDETSSIVKYATVAFITGLIGGFLGSFVGGFLGGFTSNHIDDYSPDSEPLQNVTGPSV